MINNRYFGARGFAKYGGHIWYTCYAQSDLNDTSYSAIAVRIR
jgi:hypothetical protein